MAIDVNAIRARLAALKNVALPKKLETAHEWEVFKFHAPADIAALLACIDVLENALQEICDLGTLDYVASEGCTQDGRLEAAAIACHILEKL